MSWVWLLGAIALEVGGTTCMKLSEGFQRLGPSAAMFVLYAASLGSLTMALKTIEVSVAYAIWSGLGTALITLVGIVFLGESASLAKALFVGVIILGVAGLHLAGGAH